MQREMTAALGPSSTTSVRAVAGSQAALPERAVPASPAPLSNPDEPVRVEVAMPRDLFDRLTDHDDAPRCRYDMATGRAEFVAAPLLSHESRAAAVGELFSQIGFALADAGSRIEVLASRATRVLSDDGAFEPDEGLFIGASRIDAAERVEGWLDVRKGHPVPDLVVEIDRSTDSSNKLAPYFRMGVREAWTWSRRSGTVIWGVDPEAPDGFRRVDASVVLPGVTRAALARLLDARSGADRRYHLRRLASIVASKMLAPGDGSATFRG
jgi:Uma2 family endonuclease